MSFESSPSLLFIISKHIKCLSLSIYIKNELLWIISILFAFSIICFKSFKQCYYQHRLLYIVLLNCNFLYLLSKLYIFLHFKGVFLLCRWIAISSFFDMKGLVSTIDAWWKYSRQMKKQNRKPIAFPIIHVICYPLNIRFLVFNWKIHVFNGWKLWNYFAKAKKVDVSKAQFVILLKYCRSVCNS